MTSFPDPPPQRLLFDAFLRAFAPLVPDLPAFVPEVWLRWDPKTQMERGPDALGRFRMDFLLLLPGAVRVVVEVDGKHHYAAGDRADPGRYGKMVAADRDLKLAGYEVYRFGAAKLANEAAALAVVKSFFDRLFRRHGIHVPA